MFVSPPPRASFFSRERNVGGERKDLAPTRAVDFSRVCIQLGLIRLPCGGGGGGGGGTCRRVNTPAYSRLYDDIAERVS